jgi:hypothetical protein
MVVLNGICKYWTRCRRSAASVPTPLIQLSASCQRLKCGRFLKTSGSTPWRAVDHEGGSLDMLVQSRRDRKAAVRLMRKLLRKQGRPVRAARPGPARQSVRRPHAGPGHRRADPADRRRARRIHVDKGYRGHDHRHKFRVWITGQVRCVTKTIRREMKRRAAVEPVIGHTKAEYRMGRNYLKGRDGRSEPRLSFPRRLARFDIRTCALEAGGK